MRVELLKLHVLIRSLIFQINCIEYSRVGNQGDQQRNIASEQVLAMQSNVNNRITNTTITPTLNISTDNVDNNNETTRSHSYYPPHQREMKSTAALAYTAQNDDPQDNEDVLLLALPDHENEHDFSHDQEKQSSTSVAKTGLFAATTLLGLVFAGSIPFLRRFTGAPYVSSSVSARRAIGTALHTHVHRGGHVIDLGSGSGEILVDAAVRHGLHGTGYELNLWLVAASRVRAWRAGVNDRVSFKWKDMWTADVASADAVVVFGVPDIMARIKAKINSECREGCLVCCNTFPIPGVAQLSKSGGVWFYVTTKTGV